MDDYHLFLWDATIRITPPTLGAIVALAAAGLLLFGSAFISASEVAFFSLKPKDRSQLDEQTHRNDPYLLRLLQQSQHLLATILILNNFINVSIIILCNYFFVSVFDFSDAPVVGFVLQTLLLTFLLLLFGEVMPKIYAQNYPLKFSRFSSPVLIFFDALLRPFSNILVRSTSIFRKMVDKKNENFSLNDLSHVLDLTTDETDEDKQMLAGIIRFGDKTVKEVMTARLDISAFDHHLSFREVLHFIVDCGYSRIPVYAGSQDTIKGILYIKDLLPHIHKPDNFRWQTLIRNAYFVPETKKVDGLLEEFQTNKIHIAIVVDEYGGTSGLITLEDILEEIVGDINDEYDDDEKHLTRMNDGSYLVDAKTSIEEFCRDLDLDVETFDSVSGEADTLAGMILEIKGEFPLHKEVVEYKGHRFEVIELDKRRIKKLKYSIEES